MPDKQPKKTYERPTMTVYGDLTEMTKGKGSNNMSDHGQSKNTT
jgi:hypothetical protein